MPGKKESRRARTTPVNTWRRRSRTLELLPANENNETMIQIFVERHILRAIHTIGNQTSTFCVAGARVEGQLSESWSCSAAHGMGLWTYRRFMLLRMLVEKWRNSTCTFSIFHLFAQRSSLNSTMRPRNLGFSRQRCHDALIQAMSGFIRLGTRKNVCRELNFSDRAWLGIVSCFSPGLDLKGNVWSKLK